MRREPVGDAAPVRRLVQPRQRRQHVGDAVRIPSLLGRVAHAQPIRFDFVVSAVFQEEDAQRRAAEARERIRRRHEDAEREQAQLSGRLLRVLPHAVARGDVADLVAQDAGQLRLVVEIRQDAARDVDVAAWQRKRVHGGGIDDGELPRQPWALGGAGQPHADVRDVALQPVVLVGRHLALDFSRSLTPELQLLLLGHQRDFLLAGGRVGGAGGRGHPEQADEGRRDSGRPPHASLIVQRMYQCAGPAPREIRRESACS